MLSNETITNHFCCIDAVSMHTYFKREEGILYPSIDEESYEVVYEKSRILIKANGKDSKNNTIWMLQKSLKGYDVILQGKSCPFLSNQQQFDTRYQFEPFSKRIVNKKLNDSLYISTINILAPNEVMELEVAYTRKYEIKQVRHQTIWIDYTPKGYTPLQYMPLLYRYPAPKDMSVKC